MTIAHLLCQHFQGHLCLLQDLRGLGSPACLGHPLLLRKEDIGETCLRVHSAETFPEQCSLSPTAPGERARERPGRLLLPTWSPLGNSVSVGMSGERPRPGLPGAEVPGFPGTVHIPWSPPGLPTSPLPSPSLTCHIPPSYLWAQVLLWGLVCLEVPCWEEEPLFQLDQTYL